MAYNLAPEEDESVVMAVHDSERATVRVAATEDAEAVAAIDNHFVLRTIVTFEEDPVSPAEVARRMDDVRKASLPWLVAERAGAVVGYAYATGWRVRRGYRYSAEVTVYVDPGAGGRGIGSLLYTDLIAALQERGIHAAMGGIALPNDASVALHEKFGFKKVAHFEQVGVKFDRWIDVGYWQRIL
jgi:phosphinothricin acetyltransferase